MNEKMSKRRIQITDLPRTEIHLQNQKLEEDDKKEEIQNVEPKHKRLEK